MESDTAEPLEILTPELPPEVSTSAEPTLMTAAQLLGMIAQIFWHLPDETVINLAPAGGQTSLDGSLSGVHVALGEVRRMAINGSAKP